LLSGIAINMHVEKCVSVDVKADSDDFEFIAKKHCGKIFVEQNKRNVTTKQKFSDTLSEMA